MGFWSRAIRRTLKANIRDAQRKKVAEQRAVAEKQAEIVKQANKVKEQAEQYLSTAREAAELVNTTTKPSVFFSKYALLLGSFEKLLEMGTTGVYDTSSYNPRENYQKISGQFAAATNDFIDRSFKELQEKAALVEAEQARKELTKQYFKSMDNYLNKMEAESINYYYSLKEQHNKK